MRLERWCLWLIFLVGVSYSVWAAGAAPESKSLAFGEEKDNNLLELGKQIAMQSLPRGDIGVKDPAVGIKSAAEAGLTETVTFTINTSECSLHKRGSYVHLKVGNLRSFAKPGEPYLPMKTITITLDKDTEVKGVEVVDGSYVLIKNKLNIIPMPEAMPISGRGSGKGGQSIPNKKIYSQESFFPGKAVSYYSGADREKRYVSVRLFPVQYIPKTGEAILITSATVNIYYMEVR